MKSPSDRPAGRSVARRRTRRVPVLEMPIQRSKRLTILLFAIHCLAGWVVLNEPWMPELRAIAVLCIAFQSGWGLRMHAIRVADSAVVHIRIVDEDRIELSTRSGSRVHGRLDGSTFVLPWMIVLRVSISDRFCLRSVVVLPDAVRADHFRRLRVRLRWARLDPAGRSLASPSL